MENLHRDLTNREAVTLVQEDGAVRLGEGVTPLVAAFIGEVESRLRPRRELTAAGAEVGVDMGLGDVGDAEIERGGEGEVLVDVAGGVDDQRLLRLGTPDEVARLCELGVPHPLEQH
jgi:hypothetical protein